MSSLPHASAAAGADRNLHQILGRGALSPESPGPSLHLRAARHLVSRSATERAPGRPGRCVFWNPRTPLLHSRPYSVPTRAPSEGRGVSDGSASSRGLGMAKTTELGTRNAWRPGHGTRCFRSAPPRAPAAATRSRRCPEKSGLSLAAAGHLERTFHSALFDQH